MEGETLDLVIIGGGAGGVPAAIRAAQLGGRVCIIENRDLGGYCMNRGCIPFGHMMEASEILGSLSLAKEMGIDFFGVTKDYGALANRKNQLTDFMRQGVKSTLRKRGIEVVQGKGKIAGEGMVEVNGKAIPCKTIILATGATWSLSDFPGCGAGDVLSGDDILQRSSLPANVLLYGRSPWIHEIAQFLNRYDVKTIVATPEKRILSEENKTISTRLAKRLRNEGIEIHEGCEVVGVSRKKGMLEVELSGKKIDEKITVEKIVSLERKAALEGLGLENAGLDAEGEYLSVDQRMETSAEGIYAVGDVSGPPARHYSHLATQQGMAAAENAMGGNTVMNRRTVARVLFTQPQVACVGLTTKEAKNEGHSVVVGAAPLSMNPYGMIISETEGLIEVVADKEYGEILGVHIIGKAASEIAGQAVLAIQMEATLEDLAYTPFPHPTLSEWLAEAARNAMGKHIYLPD